jgi:hypothetical protein
MQADPIVVDTIISLIKFHHEAKGVPEKWIKTSLKWPIRYLEMFIEHPKVSVEAQEMFQKLQLQGMINSNVRLENCSWSQQTTLMKIKGHKIFHYDHIYPVSQLRDKLMEICNKKDMAKMKKDVEEELKRMDVAWILKDENVKLDKAGYKSKRPYPNLLDAYAEVGIELIGSVK